MHCFPYNFLYFVYPNNTNMRKESDKMKKDAWEKFNQTGRVDDYLKYKGKQQDYLNEMGTEVFIKGKGGRSGKNSRRDRSKND